MIWIKNFIELNKSRAMSNTVSAGYIILIHTEPKTDQRKQVTCALTKNWSTSYSK